jgi:hypothetical protein
VENWLVTLKNFVDATPMNDFHQLTFGVSLLRDETLLWWRNLTRGGTDASEPESFLHYEWLSWTSTTDDAAPVDHLCSTP